MLRAAECPRSPRPMDQILPGPATPQFLIVALAIKIPRNFMKTNSSHEF
jgi:hypothetical protein